jgi:hypothetical protein
MSKTRIRRSSSRTGSARTRTSKLKLAAVSLAFAAALAATGYYAMLMLSGPVVKPVPAADATPRPAKSPDQPQTTLNRIGQVEAARQSKPAGPLYDPRSSNVALAFESIPLDDPQVAEAQAVLAQYLQAATWQEKRAFIFEPERCEALMKEHSEKRGEREPEHGALLGAGFITAGTSKVLNLQFAYAAWPDSGLRANFHRNRNGKLMLDWESWAAWSEKTWPALKKDRSSLPTVMRAIASESSYYNYEFSEDWRWLAIKLRSPDGLHSVTGYVKRDSVLGIAFANLIGTPLPAAIKDGAPIPALRPAGSKALVTVRLTFPLNAQSDHCVNITDLLADRWLLFPGEQ